MTVCIGAIAEKSILIGLSDRMLTAGDGQVEFEPEQLKAWQFSTSIFALVSGDLSIQSQVLGDVDIEVNKRINKNPEVWLGVREVAELYCDKLRKLRRKHAEEQVLFPLGLDFPTFLAKQAKMHETFVEDIKQRLIDFEFPNALETLFMGIDTDVAPDPKANKRIAAQLYATFYDRLSCLTTIGFSAIGVGRNHAESQFMFSGHWPQKSFDETLLLAYAAKKRAEAAPGVGTATDIIVIGPGLANSVQVERQHIEELDVIYRKIKRSSDQATNKAQKSTSEFVVRVRDYYQKKRAKLPVESTDSKEPSQGKDETKKKATSA